MWQVFGKFGDQRLFPDTCKTCLAMAVAGWVGWIGRVGGYESHRSCFNACRSPAAAPRPARLRERAAKGVCGCRVGGPLPWLEIGPQQKQLSVWLGSWKTLGTLQKAPKKKGGTDSGDPFLVSGYRKEAPRLLENPYRFEAQPNKNMPCSTHCKQCANPYSSVAPSGSQRRTTGPLQGLASFDVPAAVLWGRGRRT